MLYYELIHKGDFAKGVVALRDNHLKTVKQVSPNWYIQGYHPRVKLLTKYAAEKSKTLGEKDKLGRSHLGDADVIYKADAEASKVALSTLGPSVKEMARLYMCHLLDTLGLIDSTDFLAIYSDEIVVLDTELETSEEPGGVKLSGKFDEIYFLGQVNYKAHYFDESGKKIQVNKGAA